MDLNENKINESNENLDSFIISVEKKLIDEIHLIENLSEFNYIEVSQKRTGRKLTIPDYESIQSCLEVSRYIGTATISRNIDIIQALEKLKIKGLGDWFTNFSVLRKEFEVINSSDNFRINPYDVLNEILVLNTLKVASLMLNHYFPSWEKSRNDNLISDAYVNVEETKQIRILKGKLPYAYKLEKEVFEIMDKYKSALFNMGINKSPLDFLKGNIDSIVIRNVYDKVHSFKKVSESKKKLILFPLFKLILKDRRLLTEKEFYTTKSALPTYEDYIITTVSNLLNLK